MAKTANKSPKVDIRPEHALTKNEVTRLKKMLALELAGGKQRDKDVILRAKLIMLQKELA